MVDEGVVVELGTHRELLAKGNQYAGLVQRQIVGTAASLGTDIQLPEVSNDH